MEIRKHEDETQILQHENEKLKKNLKVQKQLKEECISIEKTFSYIHAPAQPLYCKYKP